MSDKILNVRLRHAVKTEAEWLSADPVLLKGELAFSSDKQLFKQGDGQSKWSALSYNQAANLDGLTASIIELNYVKGVTSNIQTQLDAKATFDHKHDSVYVKKTGDTMTGVLQIGSGDYTHTVIHPSGVMSVHLGSTEQGFARGIEYYNSSGNIIGSIGIYGTRETGVIYGYLGTSYNSPWLKVTPTGEVTATKFIGQLNGHADSATYLKRQGIITSFDALDAFHNANGVQYATLQIDGLTDATGMKANNALILSLPYANDQYGVQILIDDDPNPNILFRHRSSGVWQNYSRLLSTGNYSNYALPLTGGVMTGPISYKTATTTTIPLQVYDDGVGYGQILRIGAGGLTIVGAGESSGEIYNSIVGKTSEDLYLVADGGIYFYSKCDTFSNRIGMVFNAYGELYPTAANTGCLGTSSYKWASVYANKFFGVLEGNAISADKATIATTANYLKTTNATGFATDQYGNFIHQGTGTTDNFNIFNNAKNKSLKYVFEAGTLHVPTSVTAPSFIGNATSADKASKLANTSAIGSATNPVYFSASGVPVACTYSLNKTVPSDAKFTDTTYSQATSGTLGLVKIGYSTSGKNYAVQLDSNGRMYVNVPWTDTNTTYSLSSFGITASATELNYMKGVTSAVQTQLNARTRHIDLTGQCQKTSYRRSVIALCKTSAANTGLDSYSCGTIVLHRGNGLTGCEAKIDIFMTCQYGGDGVVNVNMISSSSSIRPCTFTYNGVNYGGIEVYINAAEASHITFDGTTNFEIFGLDYYNTSTSAALITEVNNSLKFDKIAYMGSALLNSSQIITADNYTSYTVTKTGSGASGTWGISISGLAATATALTSSAGSATKPIYFSSGKPVACTYTLNAEVNSYSGSLASGGWKTLGGRSNGSRVTVSYNNAAATWNSDQYSSTIVFGAGDTKGMLDCSHSRPAITFGGGSVGNSTDNDPKWYFKIYGTSGKIYTMPSDSGTLARLTDNVASSTVAAKLGRGGSISTPMVFNWSGQSGQPTWLWGGNDGTNMYVYNPSNFVVERARTVTGTYTSNGGQQNPNYFGMNKIGFLMMNTTVNGNSHYKDWMIMDCYAGNDVGGAVAIGVNRQTLGAYIMRSAAARSTWDEKAELLHTSNYSSYAMPKAGGTFTGAIALVGNQYYETNGVTGLNANNSDLTGLNGLYFADICDGAGEGINFYNASNKWDTLYTKSGKLYFHSARSKGATNAGNAILDSSGGNTKFIGQDYYIAYPGGGQIHNSNSSVTGLLKITLPVSWNNTMMKFKVSIYNYTTGNTVEYIIGGYNYSPDKKWSNCTAYCNSTWGKSLSNLPVSFGHDGSKCAITIGTTSTVWSYPKAVITEIIVGHSGTFDQFKTDWSLSFVTSALSTVSTTISNTNTGYSVNYASSAGTASAANVLNINNTETKNSGRLQFFQKSNDSTINPDTGWWSLVRTQHGGYTNGYWQEMAYSFGSDVIKFRRNVNGTLGSWKTIAFTDGTIATATNADKLDGYHGSESNTASTYVLRTANNYIYTGYINSNTGNNENPTISQFVVTNGSDHFYRKASLAHVQSTIKKNLFASIPNWIDSSGLTQTITVTGDKNTFYPVVITVSADKQAPTFISVWKNLGSKTPSIEGNHSNGTSSMWLQYEARNNFWDGNGGYLKTLYRYMGYGELCSNASMLGSAVGALCLWLRGGTCEYKISCTNAFTVTPYYSSTNVGSTDHPVNIAPRTDIGNRGMHSTVVIGYGNLSGNADSATKLTTSAGSGTQPIYFIDGKPTACTYSLNKSVPSNAVFTDTDTKNTAGSTDTSSKIFLIGATSQAANPQTYSHNTVYVGTDGCLYSNSTKVSVEGHTHSYLTNTPAFIEFSGTTSSSGHGGHIDFHYNGDTADYTSRIIESAKGLVQVVGNLSVSSSITCTNNITSSVGNIKGRTLEASYGFLTLRGPGGGQGEYINFYFGGASSYTTQISETSAGAINCTGTFTATKVFNAVWNDYAEYFERGEVTEAGDIVALDLNSDIETYTKAINGDVVCGIHSDSYGHLIGGKNTPQNYNGTFEEYNNEHFIPVGMVGRVYCKVVGHICKGDAIYASEIPGVGVVQNENSKPQSFVGYACENYDSDKIGRIKVLLRK